MKREAQREATNPGVAVFGDTPTYFGFERNGRKFVRVPGGLSEVQAKLLLRR